MKTFLIALTAAAITALITSVATLTYSTTLVCEYSDKAAESRSATRILRNVLNRGCVSHEEATNLAIAGYGDLFKGYFDNEPLWSKPRGNFYTFIFPWDRHDAQELLDCLEANDNVCRRLYSSGLDIQ